MVAKDQKQQKEQHELVEFRACAFGDGGFYYHDGADRAICSCGWKSAAVQRDKTALVALWKAHCELSQSEPSQENLTREERTSVPPKYSIGQRVKVLGWGGSDFGTIEEIKKVFHSRLEQYVWGYKMKYEGNGPGLSLVYVPEGYLRLP